MSAPNDPCRRLLLSEILLEENESLGQPLDDAERKTIEEAIRAVIGIEESEKECKQLPVLYCDLAQAYETLLYKEMYANFERDFLSNKITAEGETETDLKKRTLDRLDDIWDRMIDAYAHGIALGGNDPSQAASKTWCMIALTGLYERPHHNVKDDLHKMVVEIRKSRLPPRNHLSRAAETLHSEIVSKIYRLMANAHKDKATKDCDEKKTEWGKELGKKVNADVVERAVVAEIFGKVEDLRLKYKTQDAEDVEDTEARASKQEINDKVVEVLAEGGEDAYDWELGVTQTGLSKVKPAEDVSIEDASKKLAQTYRSALCLSGGGIRSAVFNLGILQGLARHGLLENFDYLSTVSGGGFSGGWLSAWIYREGLTSVVKQLREPPKSSLKPEPAPLEHFRLYSNYLSPQPGLLSADSWTLVASLLRNLILNWMVFLPVIVVLLMAPRLWTAILFRSSHHVAAAECFSLVIGLLAAWVSFTFIGWSLPRTNSYQANPVVEGYKSEQGPFVIWCLLSMTISAAAFAVYFRVRLVDGLTNKLREDPLRLWQYLLLAVAVILIPWIICILKLWRAHRQPAPDKRTPRPVLKIVGASIVMLLAQVVTGYLLQFIVNGVLLPKPGKELFYATFAVPLILLFMSLGGTLIAGFTSQFTGDQDQEWWARSGGWLLIVVVSWSAIHLLVLYGPTMFLALGQTYQNIVSSGIRNLPWRDIGKIAATVVGVISGIITLLGGFSSKTPANAREAEKAGVGSMLISALTIIAAPIFLAFVFILIALGTDWLLTVRGTHLCSFDISKKFCGWLSVTQVPPRGITDWHLSLIKLTPLRYLLLFTILLSVLIVAIGRLISTNNFSLQSMWRNRIVRACLGASRRPGTRRPNPFTGFDTFDNLLMHELRPQPPGFHADPLLGRPVDDWPDWRKGQDAAPRKLMHVLNLALNLTGGKKLQWQDRKAESFTVSPLHAGSYWLGYRRSFCYGGAEGISLGAAIAISGAFASPNMGYMMTSAVVRFIMALFNFRFGAWLGNPGLAGENTTLIERIANWPFKHFHFTREKDLRPFHVRSPSLSVLPIVSEAFGNIDDESSYVYLSDGGHFENLGLYEMVLRRCRFIVVSDASSDAEYSFQSLAMAVRQIRIDLGVPIQIPDFMVGQPAQDLKNKYCAIGTIRYSVVDRDPTKPDLCDEDYDGVLIYVKPSLIGEEPRDIINYWQGSRGFPQETITDQWFSEAQFESYRALGSHIIDVLCDPENGQERNQVTFAAFARKVLEQNRLDFRAFRENISYQLLEKQSAEAMRFNRYPNFQKKVKRFIDKLLD